MKEHDKRGVIETGIAGRPTDYLFRVSFKEIVRDALRSSRRIVLLSCGK